MSTGSDSHHGHNVEDSTSALNHTGTLSPLQRGLLERLQRLNFGVVEGLVVHGGQPVLDPPPRIVRELKFGAENGPRPESSLADFSLKPQVREFFNAIGDLRDGVIERIEIRHGLPFRMILEVSGAE